MWSPSPVVSCQASGSRFTEISSLRARETWTRESAMIESFTHASAFIGWRVILYRANLTSSPDVIRITGVST